MARDHILEGLKAAEALVDGTQEAKREAWRISLVIAALDNIIRHDDCPVLRAACRARYLEITDGRPLS